MRNNLSLFGRHFGPLALLAATTLLTAACSSGEDAVRGAGSKPNSFPPVKNAYNDFSETSTGDSNNSKGLEKNEILVTLEVPAGVAPEGEQTRRNLRIVAPDSLEVYRSNHTLRKLGSVDIDRRRDDNGREVIRFEDGVPEGPDVIIEARYDGEVLRALATDSDRDVKINPFSEYLVEHGVGDYTADEFSQILTCLDREAELCLNRFVWASLADQVHDFEIEIPDTLNVGGAVDFLKDRGDFTRFVGRMADYALLSNDSTGKIDVSSAEYNSVWVGFELGQTFRESSSAGSGQWGVRHATQEKLRDDNGTAFVFPALSLTTFDILGVNLTSLISDVPYNRETLIHTAGNDFFARGSGATVDYWALNTNATSPGPALIRDSRRLLAGRSLYQSVTGRGSSTIVGWTRNPFYMDAFLSAPVTEAPDRVLGGYFSAGKAIKLLDQDGELKRRDLLENHYLSVLEFNLQREEGFDLGTVDGNYNVLFFSVDFDGEATDAAILSAGLGTWNVADGNISTEHEIEQVVRRAGSVGTPASTSESPGLQVSDRESLLSTGIEKIGRLNLYTGSQDPQQEGRPSWGVGSATPDGSLLAFNLNDSPWGDGLMIAAEASTELPESGTYRLQGVSLGFGDDSNRLTHFDNARLTINGGNASFTRTTLEISHSVSDEEVSTPSASEESLSLIYGNSSDGWISISGGNLTMTGFATADGNQIFLKVRDTKGGEEHLGLVMATLESE